ncbi:MAG: DMT family transporter [Hungatella sp.]
MKARQIKSNLMLMLTALIWGAAFVAQSVSMDYVGPFTFNAARFFIGGLVLIPCMVFLKRWNKGEVQDHNDEKKRRKDGVMGGICCGAALFVASGFQQIGVAGTTVGKAGFITALYIVIVPILGIFLKKKVQASVWISVAAATAGMYLLCMTGGSLTIGRGDLSVLIGSVCFSFHILIIDHFSPKAEGVFLSCVQFFTAGILALVPSVLLEHEELSSLMAAWMPILYAGVLSCGVAYTLQVVAQKDTDPVIASLILSLESVFSVIAGWLILGETLSAREMAGCVLVFCAILLAQLPEGFLKK